MKKFLEHVAEDIVNKYGIDLSRIAVVFPNKRASLFLNEYIAIKAKRPIWSPAYITISEFFRKNSSLSIGDPIKLICEIHKSFTKCTGIDESLDHFYGWGQLLLADFDDIDKNMADASNVFKNVKDIHELDDISYLDEEQKDTLRKFFSNFTGDYDSELKKRFLKLWCHLEDIYNDFKSRLREQNIAYEGMLYREVTSSKSICLDFDKYLFVGFNVIQTVEQQLFSFLQKEGKAGFYWDFDNYYMPKHESPLISNEAGHYVSRFLQSFHNELDIKDPDIYDNFNSDKELTLVSAATENIQARYVNNWLKENNRYKEGRNTAIVLCDESLLPAVIHYIPSEAESVNITTGFPLFQTPVSSFVLQLLELKINGYSPDKNTFRVSQVLQILSHPYSKYVSENSICLSNKLKEERIYHPTSSVLSMDDNLAVLFDSTASKDSFVEWILKILRIIADKCGECEKDPLTQESLFRMYTLCNRINGLIKSGDLVVDTITLQKLIIQLINSTTIPFHGEPAEGIQVMGILETRNLDFDHVLILSCNEGNMPKGINDSSFIPYSIRKANGLTTIDNKVAIYAYYFYNLIQRASDVTITYNNSTENGHTGEMSRFMLQLMIESKFNIRRISLQAGQQTIHKHATDIEKDERVTAVLNSMDYISPTSINRYMRCPLRFYYNNIALIKEPEEDEMEEMSNRIFGNIFHLSSEKLYRSLMQNDGRVTPENITYALKHKELIERVVDESFSETMFNDKHTTKRIEYNGLQLINREVIIRYIRRLLETDALLAPFRIKDVESSVYKKIRIHTSAGQREISIGGRIDRLDQIRDKNTGTERIRIIDYKTGRGITKKINSVDEIFKMPTEQDKHADYFLQTMLYATIIRHDTNLNGDNMPVSPALLFIQQMSGEDYDPTIAIGKDKVTDIADYEEEYNANLNRIVSEIFEPTIPFRPTKDKAACEYCPYRGLCGL